MSRGSSLLQSCPSFYFPFEWFLILQRFTLLHYMHGRAWDIESADKDFEYYSQFVETIANLTLDRIYSVFNYGEDERLRNLNLRELVEFVRNSLNNNFQN